MTDKWQFTSRPAKPGGVFVKRDEQQGYAKNCKIGREKLASDLAEILGLRVPNVEICSIAGMGICAVSQVHSDASRPLREDDLTAPPYTPPEVVALKAASGLVPFLAWVGANDHGKDENLIVDDMGGTELAISAIDFGDAFAFSSKSEAIVVVSPPGFKAHFDIGTIKAAIERIKGLTHYEIRSCCSASAEWLIGDADLIAEALIARQELLQQAMIHAGWPV